MLTTVNVRQTVCKCLYVISSRRIREAEYDVQQLAIVYEGLAVILTLENLFLLIQVIKRSTLSNIGSCSPLAIRKHDLELGNQVARKLAPRRCILDRHSRALREQREVRLKASYCPTLCFDTMR